MKSLSKDLESALCLEAVLCEWRHRMSVIEEAAHTMQDSNVYSNSTRWAVRPRHWPPPVIIQKVVSLGAYLTPVGCKGSENNHSEWRICFNTGETELVKNLNDTQAKVYVILKMIIKDIMKPKNKEITSYVLKNIILWQAENTPQTEFHARSLLYWLHDGLRELRTAIEKKHLRYYMIPERNLMEACGMIDSLQHKWVADITHMLQEGPMVILRLPKIRKAIVASPEPMMWFSKKRLSLRCYLWREWTDVFDLRMRMGWWMTRISSWSRWRDAWRKYVQRCQTECAMMAVLKLIG